MDVKTTLLKREKKEGVLSDVLFQFDNSLEESLSKILESFKDNLKIGYDEQKFASKIRDLRNEISAVNSIAKSYCDLLKGKKMSSDIIQEVCSLPFSNTTQLELQLKEAYLKWNKVQIDNVPVKMSMLISAYDFPDDVIDTISDIVSASSMVKSFEVKEVSNFYNAESESLIVSKGTEESIRESYAKFITEKQLIRIMCLHMLCESLNNLAESPWSVRNLPEIDYRLMHDLVFNSNGAAVNLSKIETNFGLHGLPIIS